MKKGSKPQLDAQWWEKNKAKTIGKENLGNSLKKYQKATHKADWKAAETALGNIKAVSIKTLKQCKKLIHKETMAVLSQYPSLVDEQIKQVKAVAMVDFILGALAFGSSSSNQDFKALIPYLEDLIKDTDEHKLEYRVAVQHKIDHLQNYPGLLKDALVHSGSALPKKAMKGGALTLKAIQVALRDGKKLIAAALKSKDAKLVTVAYKQILKEAKTVCTSAKMARKALIV